MIRDIKMQRCISGNGENARMVGRVSWTCSGQEYGIESECGPSELDLLRALEISLLPMLIDLTRYSKT